MYGLEIVAPSGTHHLLYFGSETERAEFLGDYESLTLRHRLFRMDLSSI